MIQLAQAKAASQNEFSLLGVRHDRLFCLVVGRCFMTGRRSIETEQSLLRFAPGIEAILKKYA